MFSPWRMVLAIPDDVGTLPGLLAEKSPVEDQVVAYRCVGTKCELPVTSWEALAASLDNDRTKG